MTMKADKPLRICLIGSHFAEYVFALARAVSFHAEVLVVAQKENTVAEISADFVREGCGGLRTHFLRRTRNPLAIAVQALALVRAVRGFAPDVIHVQEDSKDILALALPFLGHVPVLLTVHDPKPHSGDDARVRRMTRHGRYIAQLRKRADAVLVHGHTMVDDARSVMERPALEAFVVPHGPLGQGVAVQDDVRREPGRCLFFGRIEAYKGLGRFIDVVELLAQRGVAVKGVVAGRGSDLERHRARLQSPRFELLDKFLAPEEVAREFRRADLVLMPYENATQSGVAAYAMGVGRPAVVFDVGALRELVRDAETGLVVPAGDMEALARAVQRVVEDRALNLQLSANAAALGQGELSWPQIARQSCAIYEGLARRANPVRFAGPHDMQPNRHMTAAASESGKQGK